MTPSSLESCALRVLTISTTFPNPVQPRFGIFVARRTAHIAQLVTVSVVSPVSWFTGVRLSRSALECPRREQCGELPVFYPRWPNIPGGNPTNSLLLAASIVRIATRHALDFDIIDSHFGYIDGVATAVAAAVLCKPFVVTLRGSELLHAKFALRRKTMSWALRRAAHVIAVSEELAGLAAKLGVPSGRITVIPNGVDHHVFSPQVQLRVSEGKKRILSVGNIIPLKGQKRIIKSLADLRRNGINAELTIIGGSPGGSAYRSELESLILDLALSEHVNFAGSLSPEQVAAHMSSANVFCLASEREGCPNVVREALACGLPVVATRVGGVPDLIPNDEYGYVVPPGDQEELTRSLEAALLKEWNRDVIARWGGSRTWQQVAAEVVQVLEQILVSA